LAALAGLKSLSLGHASSVDLAAQLTGLTSLAIEFRPVPEDSPELPHEVAKLVKAVEAAARNPHLQSATFTWFAGVFVAQQLHDLLTGCQCLSYLDLHDSIIDQQGLDVLLEHGTCITSLTVGSFQLTSSRADRECSWRTLALRETPAPSLLQFAFLPLRDIQSINTSVMTKTCLPAKHGRPSLAVSVCLTTNPGFVPVLHQAVTSLAAWPGLKECPVTCVCIEVDTALVYQKTVSRAARLQLLEALTVLKGFQPTTLEVGSVERSDSQLVLGKPQAKVLANAFGSSVTQLHLNSCTLLPGFWAALPGCFPFLRRLHLGRHAGVPGHSARGVSIPTLDLLCQAVPQSLTLCLCQHMQVDICELATVVLPQGSSVVCRRRVYEL
jgi:hypothetical protein